MPTKDDIAFAASALKRRLVSQLQVHQVNRQLDAFEKNETTRALPELMVSNGFISRRDADSILAEMNLDVAECPDCGAQQYVERGKKRGEVACRFCETGRARPAPEPSVKSENSPPLPSPVGREMRPFRILKPVRMAAFGPVYRAENMDSRRTVELQLFHGDETPIDRKRIVLALKNLEAAIPLELPALAKLFSAGRLGDYYYAECEFCGGPSLRGLLEQRKRLDPDAAMVVCGAALDALAAAEKAGLSGWNITSDSIIFTQSGKAKLAPFGMLAGALKRQSPGKPRDVDFYRAPELWEGKKGDMRSDLYSLGLIVFEALTGLRGFDSDDADALASMIRMLPAPDPRLARSDIPAEAAKLINRMCATDPEKRFGKASRAMFALRRIWKSGALHPVSLAGLVE